MKSNPDGEHDITNLANASDVSFVNEGLVGQRKKKTRRCGGEICVCGSERKLRYLSSEVMESARTQTAGRPDVCFMSALSTDAPFTHRSLEHSR